MIEPVERNTKLKIYKSFINNEWLFDKQFTKAELSDQLWLMQKEIINFAEKLFDVNEEIYSLNEKGKSELKDFKEKHIASKDNYTNSQRVYNEIWSKFENDYLWGNYIDELIPFIENLHWYFLPVYNDQMIVNRRVIPEEDLINYYSHFHSLQDLYKEQFKNSNYWQTLKGDINLDQECRFPIYTNRFGHEDIYKVKRIYNGWHVSFSQMGGLSTPDGKGFGENSKGGFLVNFSQDYVNYPREFHYVLSDLWEMADSTEMSIEELQSKLYDVANFVSQVEKAVGKYKPNW